MQEWQAVIIYKSKKDQSILDIGNLRLMKELETKAKLLHLWTDVCLA